MVAPQGRGHALHGRTMRWLLLPVVLLLAAGVLTMHGLGTGHGLTTTGYTAATSGQHHGPGAPSHDGSSDQASSVPLTATVLSADGGGASTRAGAPPAVTAVTALDHLTPVSSVPASDPARTIEPSGVSADDAPCQDDCGAHGAAMAMCLAVLAVALALLLAREPAALRQPWTALWAPILLGGHPLVLHRAPGLHQLCVSRT